MKLLYRNARGLANLESRLMLKKLCLSNKPDFLFLSEPWTSLENVAAGFGVVLA